MELQYPSQLWRKTPRKSWLWPAGTAVLELRGGRIWNTQIHRTAWRNSAGHHAGTHHPLSELLLLQTTQRNWPIWRNMVWKQTCYSQLPNFQVHPVPSTGVTDGHRSGKNVLLCHSSDNKLSAPIHFCFCRACTMQLKVNCSSCTAHWVWVSGSSVKPLWPPLHRQIFIENSSCKFCSAKKITNCNALYLGSKLKLKTGAITSMTISPFPCHHQLLQTLDEHKFLLSISLRASHITCKNWCQDEGLYHLPYRHSKPLLQFRWTHLLCFSARPVRSDTIMNNKENNKGKIPLYETPKLSPTTWAIPDMPKVRISITFLIWEIVTKY